ncbi:MAG: type II 3-dehydroquinate dehydratase [Candidatus Izemoplasmatales bacterium]|jgi:3-dehydroquinate dehydratase-2|nr:3-dehydroquinate dehydratase [Candidatus Izemoplasmatales bacterium]MDD3865473.1 3-dehydroquinate dehydratase [Candidatus Izemoplasmatales bacterium]
MNILIINGPNLNLLGLREPHIYGSSSYNELCTQLFAYAKTLDIIIDIRQSNHEGIIIDWIQADWSKFDGLILNPGALTHYSYAILDCLKAVPLPTIEVHLSDTDAREPFRKISVVKDACIKQIKGKGFAGYIEALDYFAKGNDIK